MLRSMRNTDRKQTSDCVSNTNPASLMRLQKFLSMAGCCSRRKGEEYIAAGCVRVNGETVTRLGVRVDPEKDRVELDGELIKMRSNPVYIALNKPAGGADFRH